MSRSLYFIYALIFTFLHPVNSQIDRNEKERNWIQANEIRVKEQTDYRYVNGELARKGFLSSKMTFDKEGRVTEIINYLKDGQVVNVSSYSFDPRGNQKEFIKYTGNKAKLSFKQTYQYDANGNKITETGFNGAEEYRNSYSYNSQGKLIAINYFLEDKLDESRQFKYLGNEVEVLVNDSEGSLKFRIRNKLDSKGNILETVKLDKSGTQLEKTTFTFNEKNQLLKEESYNKANFEERLSYNYDSDNNLVEIWHEKAGGEKYLKNTYAYRPDGRISEEKWRSSPAAEFSYKKYAYDGKGQLKSTDSFFASYKYRVLSKFTYR
ncbi:MAG: hypothetical protein U0T82_16695 [Bacteroidales bacterium]